MEARIRVRESLGTLKQLTVQPKTRARYDKALAQFWNYLRQHGLTLPTRLQALDGLLSDYIEHLWMTGAGKGLASDTVASLQDAEPHTKGHLHGTWRLLKAWSQNEIPNRAPPLPEEALRAMVGYALFHKQIAFGLSLLLGYYGTLRTGEILGISSSDITMNSKKGPAVISLGLTKGGKRAGAAESITIDLEQPLQWIWSWLHQVPAHTPLCSTPVNWRKSFNDTLVALKLDSCDFRPYSLRRGGATFWFQKWGSLDRLMLLGRWHAAKTCRIYVNEGLALLTEMKLPWNSSSRQFVRIYNNSIQQELPRLEPTRTGRSGGRGKVLKKSMKTKRE